MTSRRPKRAGTDFLNTSLPASDAHTGKKARFDARNPSTLAADDNEEDPILDLDEIGAKSNQPKRNAVELDGYDSDSSNDNFDQRAKVRAKEGKSGEGKDQSGSKEEDADMFADLGEEVDGGAGSNEDDEEVLGKKRKKEVRFMDEGDIEGQVAHSKSGGHVSSDFSLNGKGKAKDRDVESSSEDEVDEDERGMVGEGEDEQELGAGAKKKHAPKLDAFNMKNEAEEGKFDESGNFIRKATDPFAVHDSWLADSSKADMKKAKEAQEKREEDRRRRAIADDALSAGEILAALISRLEASETVLEALARLNSTKEKKKPKWQKNKRKSEAQMDVDRIEDASEVKRRETVEAITAAADQLLTRGQTEIYEAARELLMRQYKRETGEDWVDATLEAKNDAGNGIGSSKTWEYRWSDARDGGEGHGPYDGQTMIAWNEAGYFGEGVEFREIGREGWSGVVDFV